MCYVVGLSSLSKIKKEKEKNILSQQGEGAMFLLCFFCPYSREGNFGLHSTRFNYSSFYGIVVTWIQGFSDHWIPTAHYTNFHPSRSPPSTCYTLITLSIPKGLQSYICNPQLSLNLIFFPSCLTHNGTLGLATND